MKKSRRDDGGSGGIRTLDPLIKSQVLLPTELHFHIVLLQPLSAYTVMAGGHPTVNVKPARLGSSHGIQIARTREDFAKAYLKASAASKRLLVERLISYDHELECAYLLGQFVPSGRVLSGGSFYGFDEKYGGKTKTEISSGLNPKTEKRITEYSEALVRAIGIRSLSRLDYFVTREGAIYFNEINAFPGMTDTSLYPRLTEELSLGKGEFIDLLIKDALS